MNRVTAGVTFASMACALWTSAIAVAQEKEKESYTYATYLYCDVTLQERADEIVQKLDKPIYDAAVSDGSITAWGWLVHHTGGKWRRVQYHMAPTLDALLASQEKIGDQMDAKNNKALSQEAGKICNAHDDYIWRRVAGTTGPRGKAALSTYYVCDQSREEQADALIKRVFAPMFDKMVAEGKLTTWGWMQHIVGGEYRRLATMTAGDMKSLMAARGSIVAAFQDDPLASALNDICGSHTDYLWEIKFENP